MSDPTFSTMSRFIPLATNNAQSMKMIASTKLNKAQRAMAAAKAYGAANNGKLTLQAQQQSTAVQHSTA